MKSILFVVCLLLTVPAGLHAKTLDVSVRLLQRGNPVRPTGGKIVIMQRPQPFQIIIRNRSQSSVRIYSNNDEGYYDNIYLELREPSGRKHRIGRLPHHSASTAEVSQYLNPGDAVTIDMVLDPEEWDVPESQPQQGAYRVRAVYHNGGERIESDEYQVYFDLA